MEWAATALFGSLAAAGGPGKPADVRLHRLLQRQFAFIETQRGVSRLLFSDRLHQEDPALKATVRRIMERYTGYLQSIIQDGVDSGHFRQTLEPAGTARFVVAEIQGVIMRWSIYDFEFRLEDEVEVLWQILEPALVVSAETR
ncbi:MAG: TetR/AcrR family transcriptional regulator C-terminal domain-containing protein [Thiohalobacteraceae bacterium]